MSRRPPNKAKSAWFRRENESHIVGPFHITFLAYIHEEFEPEPDGAGEVEELAHFRVQADGRTHLLDLPMSYHHVQTIGAFDFEIEQELRDAICLSIRATVSEWPEEDEEELDDVVLVPFDGSIETPTGWTLRHTGRWHRHMRSLEGSYTQGGYKVEAVLGDQRDVIVIRGDHGSARIGDRILTVELVEEEDDGYWLAVREA